MDPNNNLIPGVAPTTPNPMPAPAPMPTPTPAPAVINPAADVANAAMNGATPVVTTTDLNAADVPAEPALQIPTAPLEQPTAPLQPTDPTQMLAPAPAEPAEEGPVTLAPSADFQMPEVSTVSAMPNGADPNLAQPGFESPLDQPGLESPLAGDNNLNAQNPSEQNALADGEQAPENQPLPEDMGPLIAATPVPGSIGSAKSYADIQREEAEKAAKVAAMNGKKVKLSKNTIIIIAIAIIALIGLGVGAFLIFGGSSSKTPTTIAPTTSSDDDNSATLSTLSCKRTLSDDEYKSFGAVGGTWENVFYFADDVLDGLVTNINYSYANATTANQWKVLLEAQYGASTVTPSSSDTTEEEPSTDAEASDTTTGKKTTAEMLHHSILLDDTTVTHKMEVTSDDISDWLESDAYSDTTYGEEVNADTTNIERNLDYYKGLQNKLNYTCSVSKGGSK